jgi:hypothetical protein
MTSGNQPGLSEADSKALAQKLNEFGKTLPAGQQLALRALIERGRPNAEDVQGYDYFVNWWDRYGDYLYTDIYSNSGVYEGWEDIAPV